MTGWIVAVAILGAALVIACAAAGYGWGWALGLKRALEVALGDYEWAPDPPGGEEMVARRAELKAFPDFGEKRA